MEITTVLVYNNGCFYPVSRIMEVSTEGEDLKVINYGEGECDNKIQSWFFNMIFISGWRVTLSVLSPPIFHHLKW